MSATSATGASTWSATAMFTMSLAHRLVSAGLPAPSMITTSNWSTSEDSASVTTGHNRSERSGHACAVSWWSTTPRTTTWLVVSLSGLRSTGFMRTSGSTAAASACSHWAVPISPPSTTRALLDMFWALKGATRIPCRDDHRQRAVTSRLLPALLDTPCTIRAGTAASYEAGAGRTAPMMAARTNLGMIVAMVVVSVEEFEVLVTDALDTIPAGLRAGMENVAIVVDDHSPAGRLLGLYEGVPLTKRGNHYSASVPDRITIYMATICAACRTEADVVAMVRKTVVHEVGHHFGIDDRRLAELGWA